MLLAENSSECDLERCMTPQNITTETPCEEHEAPAIDPSLDAWITDITKFPIAASVDASCETTQSSICANDTTDQSRAFQVDTNDDNAEHPHKHYKAEPRVKVLYAFRHKCSSSLAIVCRHTYTNPRDEHSACVEKLC